MFFATNIIKYWIFLTPCKTERTDVINMDLLNLVILDCKITGIVAIIGLNILYQTLSGETDITV